MPTPSISAISLAKLQKQLNTKTISPTFISKMKKEAGIQTLQDIRKAGGIPDKETLSAKEQETARRLEAHAYLNLLSEEVDVNEKLINAGISSFGAIAGTNKAAFLERAKGLGIPEETAAALHTKAEAAEAYLTHIITAARAEKASYSTVTPTTQALSEEYDQDCEVKECNSAVSPLAYLMELLVYAKEHIVIDEKTKKVRALTWEEIEKSLCQPFSRFTNACEEVDRKVRQVRIATEVLRKKGLVNQLEEKEYCFNAYKALLTQIGTSYDELRRIKSADAKKRQALADRLGIPVVKVDGLLLKREDLSEAVLERLFGLQDTTRDAISDGVIIGNEEGLIKRWNFYGVEWEKNTDTNGNIFLKISSGVSHEGLGTYGKVFFSLYRNERKFQEDLIAYGSRYEYHIIGNTMQNMTFNESIELHQYNTWDFKGIDSKISTVPDYLYHKVLETPKSYIISIIPDFLAWRLQYLRQQWQTQDSLSDAFINKELPVIDPDLIGPEDFRHPINNDPAFKLWKKRREWVDERLSKMSLVQGFTEKLLLLKTGIPYHKPDLINPTTPKPIIPWTDKVTIDLLIQGKKNLGDANQREGQLQWIQKHKLTLESFTRLAELALKVKMGKEPLLPEEWEEVDSILVQVQKNTFQDSWVKEEVASNVLLNPLNFWKSLQEPEEGIWSPLLHNSRPLIDPEVVKFEDLVPYPVGKMARAKWEMRKVELDNISKTIGQKFSKDKLKGALNYVYDKAFKTAAEWHKIIDDLLNLLGTNPQNASKAIWSTLYMSEEDFQSFYAIVDKLNQNHELSDEDVANLLKILTFSRRKKTNLDYTWKNDEASLAYWQIFRSRLPKWRASREQRALWQMALKSRSRMPIIDPDLILTTIFKSQKAEDLFGSRQTSLNKKTKDYENIQSNGKLEKLIVSELGTTSDELLGLEATAQSGTDITKRLDQIGLSYAAFSRLLDCWKMKTSGAALEESEWTEVYDILLQVLKLREYYPKWHTDEQAQGITLSPDFFELPEKPQEKFTPVPWCSTAEDRWDWEDKLQNRIDQEKGTFAAMAEAVDKAEERTIAQLRDALVKASGKDAKTLSQYLLVDMEISPCHKTTRISVAITTLQKLFFQLRMDEPITSLPYISLSDEDFDNKWKWLGSYETWRAAVVVFLYPENVLLPSLRKYQTPAFRRMVDKIKSSGKLTPILASDLFKDYKDYIYSLCTLEQPWSCASKISNEDSFLHFNFAISRWDEKIYWSVYSETDSTNTNSKIFSTELNYPDTFWDKIPKLDEVNIKKIIGVQSNNELIYVFFIYENNQIGFVNFSLEKLEWEGELNNLTLDDLPEGLYFEDAILVQNNNWSYEVLINTSTCYGGTAFFKRAVEGKEWIGDDWMSYLIFYWHKAASISSIFSLDFQNEDNQLLIFTYSSEGLINGDNLIPAVNVVAKPLGKWDDGTCLEFALKHDQIGDVHNFSVYSYYENNNIYNSTVFINNYYFDIESKNAPEDYRFIYTDDETNPFQALIDKFLFPCYNVNFNNIKLSNHENIKAVNNVKDIINNQQIVSLKDLLCYFSSNPDNNLSYVNEILDWIFDENLFIDIYAFEYMKVSTFNHIRIALQDDNIYKIGLKEIIYLFLKCNSNEQTKSNAKKIEIKKVDKGLKIINPNELFNTSPSCYEIKKWNEKRFFVGRFNDWKNANYNRNIIIASCSEGYLARTKVDLTSNEFLIKSLKNLDSLNLLSLVDLFTTSYAWNFFDIAGENVNYQSNLSKLNENLKTTLLKLEFQNFSRECSINCVRWQKDE